MAQKENLEPSTVYPPDPTEDQAQREKPLQTDPVPAQMGMDLVDFAVLPSYLRAAIMKAVSSGDGANEQDTASVTEAMSTPESAPSCPILVFINSRSGGRQGSQLFKRLESLVGPAQVFDLYKGNPQHVLTAVLSCLDGLASRGDTCAQSCRSRLRLMVAGGDGTVGWVLACLDGFQDCPPVGVIPLGTGNDLARTFGWGGKFASASRKAVTKSLKQCQNAKVSHLDSWKVRVLPAAATDQSKLQLPHAMHKQLHTPLGGDAATSNEQAAVGGEMTDSASPAFEGSFWNYLSIGMDAQIAYGFHHLREQKPWLARGPLLNSAVYSGFGCGQGWFCAGCSCTAQQRARALHMMAQVYVMRPGSTSWELLPLPNTLRALVVLNLQSYAGGRHPWGTPTADEMAKAGWKAARLDDGLMELVGLHDGWDTALVMGRLKHAQRLAQASAVKIELRGEHTSRAYLQMDGEPWRQPLPPGGGDPTLVEISPARQPSIMLVTGAATGLQPAS